MFLREVSLTFSVLSLAACLLSASSRRVSAKLPWALRVLCTSSAEKGRARTTSSIFLMITSNSRMWGPMQRLSVVCSWRKVPHSTSASGALHHAQTDLKLDLCPVDLCPCADFDVIADARGPG